MNKKHKAPTKGELMQILKNNEVEQDLKVRGI